MIANNASSVNSSSKPHHERKRDKLLAFFKFSSQKQSSVGPFFPSGHSLQSQTTNNSGRIPCAFDEAQDTNAVVASFIAADEETRAILLKRINDIIDKFDISSATLDTVRELVILGRIPDWDTFSRITERFLKAIKDSILLQTTALQGLAVILNSCPEEIDMKGKEGFYSDILGLLRLRLDNARVTQNEGELIPLLHSITTLLNAMLYKEVRALDREKIFNPLKSSLARLESHKNATVSFLTLYAKQGLNYVGNDESLEKSIFRHGWLAIRIAVDIASGIKNVDWGKFESAFGKLMEMNDISIKALWYSGLVLLDSTMYLQDWTRFEEFALKSKLKSNECFLQGACLRLEQIAATHSNGDIRDGAINFFHYILANSPKCVRQVALTILERLGTSHCAKHNGREANRYTLSIVCSCSVPRVEQGGLPAIWDPSWHSTSSATLLKHIQQASQSRREIRDTAINVSEMRTFVESTASLCSLDEVRSALKSYYKNSLKVLRVSGDTLDLESCYVNLSIVEASSQRRKDKNKLETQTKAFQRLPSLGESTGANIEFSIPLEELFDRRKLRDGDEAEPKRILIYGRAGAGKSTLCKKIVHLFQDGRWRDRFAAIIWLPLKRLKNCGFHTIDDMLGAWYFASHPEPERTTLSRTLQKSGVLYILDGLDEIVTILRSEANFNLSEFFNVLLQQQYVIITSRPSGVDKSILPGIDLEMETVGFSPQNVKDYLSMVLAPDQVQSVQRFIDQTPVVQGLVNIPVQLDVICFSWGSLPTNVEEITITGLYQAMVCKLCRKDAFRLRKKFGEEVLSEYDIDNLLPREIYKLMDFELEYLSYLAFEGLNDNHRIEFDEIWMRNSLLDIEERKSLYQEQCPPKQLVNMLKETSFLHSADIDLDVNVRNFQGSWHFLHLTFQEYFAASWVARHLQSNSYDGAGSSVQTMKEFISNEKYNPRYEIMWWRVAGQLKGAALVSFFDLLQGAPLDLIGGYHHHLLAACLKESRIELDKVDHERVESLESQLIEWLQFEKSSFDRYGIRIRRSILGTMGYLPEGLLIKSVSQSEGSLEYLVHTLQRRSSITLNAIPILLNTLQDKNCEIREFAAFTLGKNRKLPDSALQILVGALNDENSDVSDLAGSALGKQSTLPDSVLQALVGALKDEHWRVRDSAVSVLGKQSTLPDSAFQALIGVLKNEDSDHKYFAASALGKLSKLHDSAFQALVGALEDWNAAHVLGEQSTLPDSALQALVGALKDEDWRVRDSAASVLGNQSILPNSALQALVGALKDESCSVRDSAASALGKQSKLPTSALQALIDTLKDKNPNFRSSAVSALGKQSTLVDSTLQALVGALKDEDCNVRDSAASALGKQSKLPELALQALVGALKDESRNVRDSAASTLGKQSILVDSTLRALVGALKDEDCNVRDSAASALGKQSKLPELALQALIDALKDENPNFRSSAVSALGKQSILVDSTLQALVGALKDEDCNVRDSAASALGKQSKLPELALQALVGALKDESRNIRYSAASTLGKQSTLPDSALQALVGALKDEDWCVRDSAASVLGNQSTLPVSILQALVGALKDEDCSVRGSAASALGKQLTLPDLVLQALVGALKDKGRNVRDSAASALGKQSKLPELALQALIDTLKDENPNFRSSAVSALGKQSTLVDSTLQALVGALKDEDCNIRDSAASALGKQSKLPDSTLQALVGGLKDEDSGVRYATAYILGGQSTLSDLALQALIGALKDENCNVRDSAVFALGKQSKLPDFALQALIGELKDEDIGVRNSAAYIIREQSNTSDLALQALVGALKDEDCSVRGSAASALGKQSKLPDSALQALVGALKDEDIDVRRLAAHALGKQSKLPDSALQALVGALKDEDIGVRRLAAHALGKQSKLPDSALQALVDVLKDGNTDARLFAASALGKQSKLPDSALQALVDALKDEDSDVRNSSASLLGKQSTLPNSALQTLIGALQDKSIKEEVLTVLEKHPKSLFMAIPDLLPSAVEILYPAFLVRYGSQHSASLWVQGDQMSFYTAQGFHRIDGICEKDIAKIVAAFDAAKTLSLLRNEERL